MSKSLIRLMTAVLLCLTVGLGACGDPDENNTSNNGAECTENADCGNDQICDENGMCVEDTTCDTAADCDEGEICDANGMCVEDTGTCEMDEDCAEGEICEGGSCEAACTDNSSCGAGEFCAESGRCESGQCATASPGDQCDPNGDPAGNTFACVQIGEGGNSVCAETCTPPAQGESDPCPSNSQCLTVNQSGGGACIATQCSLGADECGDGAACQPISRDTNLCVATGDGSAGDDCASQFTDISSSRCSEGLFCDLFYTGVCRTPCQGDDACSGLNSCVGDGSSDIYSNAEGFCAEGCEPFGERNVCGSGAGCQPLTGDIGICEAAGDIELYGACQSRSCETDDDCPTGVTCNQSTESCNFGNQCQGDARCIALTGTTDAGQDAEARCLPACDPTAENPDETCPAANPQSFVRFQHISAAANAAGVTSVDVYVDGNAVSTDLSFPTGPISSLPFTSVDPGAHTVEIFEQGADTGTASPILSTDIDLAPNAQITYVVADSPDGSGGVVPGIQSFETPRGVESISDAIQLRLFHAIPNLPANVDVFIVPEGTSPADRANDNIPDPVVSDLGYAEVSTFPDGQGGTMPFVDLPGGASTYDAYITVTGGDPTSDTVGNGGSLLGSVTGLGAPNGSILTIAAVADASTGAPTSIALPYSSEDETRVLGGFCFDLSGQDQDPSPRTGVCFEECGGAADYLKGLCTAEASGDSCAPFQFTSVCWPSEGNSVGDSCDPTAVNSCEPGAYCRGDGAGNGVCKQLCTRTDQSLNTDLACSTTGESCAPIPYGPYQVGECRQECDVANNPDSSCPTNLQQCLPVWTDDQFAPSTNYCRQSGDTALGETCEGAAQNDCVPSALCTQGPADDNPTCRTACEMLASDTGCGDSEVCYPNFGGGSSSIGACVDEDPDLSEIPSLGQCPLTKAGNPCGDGSICIGVGQGQAACLQFCDVETDTGCSGEEVCNPAGPLFGLTNYDEENVDIPYTLGVCLPPA